MSEKIIDRVRKMLAIANDLAASEHERDTALNMAYKTLAYHNLSMVDLKEKEQEPRSGYDFQGFSFPFAITVCSSIAELFFCYYIIGEKINGTQRKHIFVGKESNAATAMVMADWIVKSILKEGRKMYKQNTSPECRSFCLGAASSLRSRVYQMMQAAKTKDSPNEKPGTALVLASLYDTEASANNDKALQLYVLKDTKSRGSSIADGDAYGRGHDFGSTINLSLQVGGEKAAPAKRIT